MEVPERGLVTQPLQTWSREEQAELQTYSIPAVTDGALHGLLESLDSNSSYLSAAQYKEYKAHKSDAKGEIGASVSKRFGYASVVSAIPGGPADKAGIQSFGYFLSALLYQDPRFHPPSPTLKILRL
jgi:C-terminal processing protease CtpA/Prc